MRLFANFPFNCVVLLAHFAVFHPAFVKIDDYIYLCVCVCVFVRVFVCVLPYAI